MHLCLFAYFGRKGTPMQWCSCSTCSAAKSNVLRSSCTVQHELTPLTECAAPHQSSVMQITAWEQQVYAQCNAAGYVTFDTSKRRRWLPNYGSADSRAHSAAQRQAVNSSCQGAAADVLKWAMVQVDAALRSAGLAEHAKMILSVCILHSSITKWPGACRLV